MVPGCPARATQRYGRHAKFSREFLDTVYRTLTNGALGLVVQVGEVTDARGYTSFHSPTTPTHHGR